MKREVKAAQFLITAAFDTTRIIKGKTPIQNKSSKKEPRFRGARTY